MQKIHTSDRILLGSDADRTPLHKQLCSAMREQIQTGQLQNGQKVPSTRDIAKQFGIARNTVLQAYRQLISEGYLETVQGSGTRVAVRIAEVSHAPRSFHPQTSDVLPLSTFAKNLQKPALSTQTFRPRLPEAQAPKVWHRMLLKAQNSDVAECSSAGLLSLRQALVSYLERTRGIRCSAEQIFIFENRDHAIDTIARLHLNIGDRFALADPADRSVTVVMEAQGGIAVPLAVDGQGLQIGDSVALNTVPLVVASPSHHFPTGATMSVERRHEVLNWVESMNALLIEDDNECEYRYGSRALTSMYALDQASRVIYLNSFSAAVWHDLRICYLVVPEALTSVYARVRRVDNSKTGIDKQAALAHLITSGWLDLHISQQKAELNRRRIAMIYALKKYFGAAVAIKGEGAGLFFVARFNRCRQGNLFVERFQKDLLGALRLHEPFLHHVEGGDFVVAFGGIDANESNDIVRVMYETYQSLLEEPTMIPANGTTHAYSNAS